MKILHLLSQRPELTGSGMYVQAVIREAARQGHENFLLAGIPGNTTPELEVIDGERCEFVRFDGVDIPFPVVGMSDVMPYRSKRFSDLPPREIEAYEAGFAARLTRAVETFSPDIIHAHHLWLMSALARKLFPRIPMATTCHGTDLRQFRNHPHLGERVLGPCGRMDGVMALTRVQAAEIESLLHVPPRRIHVVGGGYDETLFFPGRKKSPPPVEILYAGKICRPKGVLWLLASLARIMDLPWRLHLAGGGAGRDRESCNELARGLGGRATFHGVLNHAELSRLMRRCHLFVLPSFFEGLPLVLLEALASGCRLVAASLPGVLEVLGGSEGNGVRLVELPPLETVDAPFASDENRLEKRLADALREQIEAAMKTPGIDMAPFERILSRYTWGGVFGRIDAVYRTI